VSIIKSTGKQIVLYLSIKMEVIQMTESSKWLDMKDRFREICGLLSIEEILSNIELMEKIIRIEQLLITKTYNLIEQEEVQI
jgi:hypothetical protein